jgi:hypothetical protein
MVSVGVGVVGGGGYGAFGEGEREGSMGGTVARRYIYTTRKQNPLLLLLLNDELDDAANAGCGRNKKRRRKSGAGGRSRRRTNKFGHQQPDADAHPPTTPTMPQPLRERNPAYIHTLTTEFASTLDQIPQDMARQFADLRELDAVLSSSLQQITQRINDLTERIEATVQPGVQHNPTQLFRTLTEIADETGRIKLGGEDKIRVASLAADNVSPTGLG